ncbi:MAG: CPBP family intramembrane metalloprotease [Myxococcales bacterium]|nr:CPBP family intramembrane metalloprotease [Myxococcales bacterium]
MSGVGSTEASEGGLRARIRRHGVAIYLVLTFAISWGAIVAAFGLGPISAEQLATRGAFLYVALLLGPSIAGLVMLGLADGRAGLSDYRRRLLAWRVAPHWYAIALLTAPLTLVVVLLGLSAVPELIPSVFVAEGLGTRLLSGVGAGLAVALCEETGWTGFAAPRLRERHSVLVTGLVLGVVWGAWHFPPFWEGDTFTRPLAFGLLLARLLTWLPAFRVLLVWVHDRTKSLLVVILMHASLVASQFVLIVPFDFAGTGAVVYILVWAAVLWAIAVVVARGSSAARAR